MSKSKVGEFKVGDKVKIVIGESNNVDFSYGLSIGDEFTIDAIDGDGDAIDYKGRYCTLPCLELVSPKEPERRLWDGNEELEVGMWFYSPDFKQEAKALLIDGKRVAWLDEADEIIVFRLEFIQTIDQRTEKEKLIDGFSVLVEECDKQDFKDALSNFYDAAIRHKI